MGCSECRDELEEARRKLDAKTAECAELAEIFRVTMDVITPGQFSEVRRLLAARDAALPGEDNGRQPAV